MYIQLNAIYALKKYVALSESLGQQSRKEIGEMPNPFGAFL